MRTRFAPVFETVQPPDPRVVGVHLEIGDLWITGMRPRTQEWGDIWFTNLDGWWNRPGSTGESTQRTLAHGSWRNRAFFKSRIVEVSGLLMAPQGLRGAAGRRALTRGIDAFNACIPLDDPAPLVVREDGLTRFVMVRQSGEVDVKWANGPQLAVEWNVQLVCDDYRRQAGENPDDAWQDLGPAHLQGSLGGMVFPMRFPYRYTGRTTSDALVLPSTGGNAESDLTLTFRGPVMQPGYRLDEARDGQWFDVTLGRNDVLTVNLQTHAVELNGAPRRGAARGRWPAAKPGQVVHFTAGEYNPESTMLARFKEAWL